MRVFTDDDADLSVVQARNVTVIGSGAEAFAHALCLRDSGVDVRVGLAEGSPYREEAQAAGLPTLPPYDACEEADVIVVVSPEPQLASLYTGAVQPNLVPGDALVFDSGFLLRFGLITPPEQVDVVLVAPEAPGELLRAEFEAGRGTPALVGVEQDASGEAEGLALSYAKAVGATRTGAIETTVAEQAETALFAEQAVVCGGVAALVERGFQTLVGAGYSPEVAYLRCVRDLQGAAELVSAGHGEGCASLSDTAAHAVWTGRQVVDKTVGGRMQEVLERIRDGSLASSLVVHPGDDRGAQQQSAAFLLEETGRRMRELFHPQLRDF